MPNDLCPDRLRLAILRVTAQAPAGVLRSTRRSQMHMASDNITISSELSVTLGRLCEDDPSAVRVACVPSGLEYRFIVSIDARWRAEVYVFLATHTKAKIPPDGGSLNLSAREALRLCEQVAAIGREPSTPRIPSRQPRRIPGDLSGALLRDTFQP